jgi:hypothetical protein
MQQKSLYGPLRILSYIILLLMAGAIIYAFSITILHWTGIGV